MRTRTDRLHLLPATLHFDMQPALSLHALIINQREEVWEGSEFILSCMAYGSPDITFTWYKDDVKVNFNGTTRDIWTRTVAKDTLGRHMSVLGISEAKKPDSGRWSCSADDAGQRQCSALRVTILRPPDIRLVPSTLTVNKGDNVSITCLAGASRMHGVLGFSWARERSLLPQVPSLAVWEDLYPVGSVLKLYNYLRWRVQTRKESRYGHLVPKTKRVRVKRLMACGGRRPLPGPTRLPPVRQNITGNLLCVCILALLSARLFGGALLRIGVAQTVCAASCAMLTVLCLALAVCAALRLRNITHKSLTERRTYLRDRWRVVYDTLVLLVTTSAVQAAGVWWVQPGSRTLSAAALVNGVTMLVCYVIRDEECLQSAKRILSLPSHRDWQESPVGETSLNLYIKQGCEVENRGGVGMLESTSSQVSPVVSYWRAPSLESPARIHSTTHVVCDLIPHSHTASQRQEYMAQVCLELGVLRTPPELASSLFICSMDFKPYTSRHFYTYKDRYSNFAHSNPDVSKIYSRPVRSCLKKSKQDFISSISLPSIESKKELKSKSNIEQVNREWNKAYETPETEIMLNKISNDLDFLLNRIQKKNIVLDQIEEAPT